MKKKYLIKIIKEVMSEQGAPRSVTASPGRVYTRAAELSQLASQELSRRKEEEKLEKELKDKKLKPRKFGPQWTVERLKAEYIRAKQGVERLRIKHSDVDVFWSDQERKERDQYLRTLHGVLSDPRMKDIDMIELVKESIQKTIKVKILKSR